MDVLNKWPHLEQVLLNPQHDYTRGLMSDAPLLCGRESIMTQKA